MAGCRCRKAHLNDLCSYTTVRQVRIKDYRLGCLNFFFSFAIFVYVVVYSVVVQQRYRIKALDGVGSTRLQLRLPAPAYNIDPLNTSYCTGGTAPPPAVNPLPYPYQAPCRYYDQYDAVAPMLEPYAMFVSTRISEYNSTLPDGCDHQPVPTCSYVNGPQNTYYVGNVEWFTLLLDHTFTSQTLGISLSAMGMKGYLLDQSGAHMNPCSVYSIFPAGCDPTVIRVGAANGRQADIVPLMALLVAGGVNSLDQSAGAALNETSRAAGIVLVVSVQYSNYYADTGSFLESYYEYTYSVSAVQDAEFKAEEVLPNPGSGVTHRTILDRHGIRILVRQSGNVGQFDLPTLLVSLTSSLGLVAVAVTLVDYLAVSCMPLRNVYAQYKKVDSVDFEGVHLTPEDLNRFAHEDMVNPKPRFVRKLAINSALLEEGHGDGSGGGGGGSATPPTYASTAAALAAATSAVTATHRVPVQPSTYGLNTTVAPYGYVPPPPAAGAPDTDRTPLISHPSPSAGGGASGERRGSGISLKSHQVRPLPPGAPPPGLPRVPSGAALPTTPVGPTHSGSFASSGSGTGPHHAVGTVPRRAPFESIASGDGSESDLESAVGMGGPRN